MHEPLKKQKFAVGQEVLATPGALSALEESGQSAQELLWRHVRLEQGDLDDEDQQLNFQAVQDGSRIFSSYRLSNGTRLWVISEAAVDAGYRPATTLLLPEEY